VLTVAPGCEALHRYRPLSVLVQDAETKQPIPGVHLHLSYPLARSSCAPWESSGMTGDNGVARLRAAPYGDEVILVEAEANGYLPEQKNLSAADVQALEPAHLFEAVERRPVSLVVELYAGPRPSVELVLPADYHGLVKVEVVIDDDAPCPPGHRCF